MDKGRYNFKALFFYIFFIIIQLLIPRHKFTMISTPQGQCARAYVWFIFVLDGDKNKEVQSKNITQSSYACYFTTYFG